MGKSLTGSKRFVIFIYMDMRVLQVHELFRSLSDPVRLRIAVMLTQGERCVCDIQKVLEIPQSTVSRHLGIMRSAGLLRDRREGKWVHYRLAEGDSPITQGLLGVLRGLAGTEGYAGDVRRVEKITNTKEKRC